MKFIETKYYGRVNLAQIVRVIPANGEQQSHLVYLTTGESCYVDPIAWEQATGIPLKSEKESEA
jgi:hypothetical protein